VHVPVTLSLLRPFAIFCGSRKVTTINYQRKINLTHNATDSMRLNVLYANVANYTKNSVVLRLPYKIIQMKIYIAPNSLIKRDRHAILAHFQRNCSVFLKQSREKLFATTTKHLCATFGQFFCRFSADFSAQFAKIVGEIAKSVQNLCENALELCASCANCTQF